jgi:hypothetical protein
MQTIRELDKLAINTSRTLSSQQAPAKLDRKSLTCEPERQLWELTRSTNSKKLATIELFVFVLLLILASVAMVAGFAELSHLLQTDAVGHVATRVIS